MESPFRHADLTAPDLYLIETLGWDGCVFARLPLHLDRLARSAQLFGWPCEDAAGLAAALRAAAPPGAARMRLTLDARGMIAVQSAPLPPSPAIWRLGLAKGRLASDDPWLGVKSSHRVAYDAARATLPQGWDEAIFCNERDEVCDGSITTLFFDRGTGLCTPPLTSGLLPGVLRAQMLASGAVREAVLHAQDLPRVRLWLGNSLRGLMSAVWLG